MTAEKYLLLILVTIIFITCIAIFLKSSNSKKKYLFSSVFGSMGLGISSLLALQLSRLMFGVLLEVNLCTVLVSLLSSLPGVAAMLFLNII